MKLMGGLYLLEKHPKNCQQNTDQENWWFKTPFIFSLLRKENYPAFFKRLKSIEIELPFHFKERRFILQRAQLLDPRHPFT